MLPFHTLLKLVWQTPPAARHTVYTSISPPVPQHPTVICHTHTLSGLQTDHTHTCRGLASLLQCMWQWISGWESGIRFLQCRAEGCMGTCIDTADSFRRGKPHGRSAGNHTHTHTLAWFIMHVLCVCFSSCHKEFVKWGKVRQTKGLVTRIQLEFIKGTF